MKNATITIRINSELKNIIQDLSKDYKITLSSFINMILIDAITNNKVSKEFKKRIKIYVEKIRRKELCNQLYISKNMYRRVIDMALSSNFVTGSINMKAINAVIDSFVAEFECYDASLKNKIGTDFRITVKRLRNKEFLLSQSKTMKMLNYTASK
tara:strand:+ start:333 stop:797 length:465 start_codon:yes stop_codon:yes gene_type:complete